MLWLIFFGTIAVLLGIGVIASNAETKALRSAKTGATRVAAIKAVHVNSTVAKYSREGWQVVDQTTAKSLGSQTRVTITFRKG